MNPVAGGRFAVTGGRGFIGKVLVRSLLRSGAESVLVIDPRCEAQSNANQSVIERRDDLSDVDRLSAWLEGLDAVFHFGASTDMTWKPGAEQRDLQQGLRATINLLEAMRRGAVRRLVYASSSAVYGDLAARGAREVDGPLLPCSTYGAAKLASEGWISAYTSLFSWSTLIVRFGNVIGPDMDRGVLFDVVRRLATVGEPVRVLGDGSQGRTYVDVDDACACVLSLFAKGINPGSAEVFNVTGHGLVTTLELATIVGDALSLGKVRVETEGTPRGWAGDVPQVRLSTEKLAGTGWTVGASEAAVRSAARGLWERLREPGGTRGRG